MVWHPQEPCPAQNAKTSDYPVPKAKPIHCAAVDLGATSGRVIVGSWSGKKLATKEVHRFPNQFRSLAGHDYWDVPYLWSEVQKGLVEAKRQYPDLASVGVDTWAVDYVLVDKTGRPVFPVHAYRDKRTEKASARLERHGIETVYALTGIPNYPYNTSLQLQETLTAAPDISDVADRCLFLSDYFNFLLSGRMENEISIASHSQLLDVHGRDWSSEALAVFDIPHHWFSKPVTSPRRFGRVKSIPELKGVGCILVPGHDTACAFTAMPAAADGGDLYLSSGTWSLLGFESDRPVTGARARSARVSNERMGDGRYRPLLSCLGLWLLEQILTSFATRPRTDKDWKTLIATASAAREPKALLDVTDSKLFNPPSMRAAIDNQLKRRRQSRPAGPRNLAGYVRLICESLGQGHADAVRLLEQLAGRQFNRILITGGGSKNSLLCQATANRTGIPVVSLALEGTAIGNLASQLIALGVVKDLAVFRRHLAAQLHPKTYRSR